MAERYATVVTNDDGQEVISNISLFEGKPEQPRGDAKLIKIGDGPKIGMVKGGKGEAADGWGFDIPVAEESTATRKATAKRKTTAKKDEGDTSGSSDAGSTATAGSTQE